MNDLGIAVMACHRPHCLINCLSSISLQQKHNIHLWLDLSIPQYRELNSGCKTLTQLLFPYVEIHEMKKCTGIAGMMCAHVLPFMADQYKYIICIEEDVFLAMYAIKMILNNTTNMSSNTFSVFGDHAPGDKEFRSICWGTTGDRLLSILPILMRSCGDRGFLLQYLTEHRQRYIQLAGQAAKSQMISNIPEYHIMWGDLIGYIAVLNEQTHQRTEKVCAYHMGVDKLALHYNGVQKERQKNPNRHIDICDTWGKFISGGIK